MKLITAVVLLLTIMDPVGNIPVFLSILNKVSPERRFKIILREALIALVALLMFMFLGRYILDVFDLSEPSLRISGGIILFLMAIKMIFPSEQPMFGNTPQGEPFIVPLAIPLIAGPSALIMVMIIMNQDTSRWLEWLLALIIAWSISATILLLSGFLKKILRERGIIAMERLMGMLLTTISVEMLITGINNYINSLN